MKPRNIFVFCIFAAAVMLMTVSVFAQSISPTEELYYNRLKALEILPADFDWEKEITRSELADVVCRMYGIEDSEVGQQIFSDVPQDHPYYYSISAAYINGLMGGFEEGSFLPDEPVTNEQMIKVLIGMAGYDDTAARQGGYPTGYMKIATQNSVLAPGAMQTDNVTGSMLVHSVYKTMEMPVVYIDTVKNGYLQQKTDSEKTLLYNLMDSKNLSYHQGIVNFDGVTHINKSDKPNIGFAEINGEQFVCDINIKPLLGRCVEFWLRDDEVITDAYEYKDKNNVSTFLSKDIDSADFDQYSVYDENKKRKAFKLEKSINVIYNGQGMESFAQTDLIPANGDVTLIDNDDDGLFEIVIVTDKRYYVVDSAGNGGLSVKYKKYGVQTESGYYIKEDELENDVYYAVYDGDGNEISPESISPDSVVSVARSKNGSVISVILTKKKVDGKVDILGYDTITINGVEYDIAIGADGDCIELDARAGRVTEAYLNENGEVVYCNEGISSDIVYGYIYNTWEADGGDEYYVRFAEAGSMGTLTNRKYWWVSDKLVQNSAIREYKIAKKAKIDGRKNTPQSIENLKYSVCEIKIQKETGSEPEINVVDRLVPDFEYTKGKYNHNTGAMVQPDLFLSDYDNPAVLLKGNIKTLVIPASTAEKYDKDCYLAKYRIENDVSTHNVAFYGIPEDSQTPKLLVMKTVLTEVGTAGGDNETCIMTSNIMTGINDDGENCYFANVYDKNGNESQINIRDDFSFADSSVKNAVMDLRIGDVLEISRDGQNRVLEIKVIASASNPIDGTQMGEVEKLQQNVIWNKSNGDDFYNVFFYVNRNGERVEAGIKSDYPIFSYTKGKHAYVDKIGAADVVTDDSGIYADTVIIAGDIAVVLPID